MTTATLIDGAYEGFRLQIGGFQVDVRPVGGQSLAAPDAEIQLDVYMADEDGTQRCALTERVTGAQQLRAALTQWRAILS
ncbi:hypothetical protein OHB41_51350 [Streptomyces sp. NBC_01571]|uniref:hypothetical protein n=1 Tax=Streptomyces sp. NBC_01571 TaxID=2975883 RepID=UPI0022521F38|nr:hypothetical protein [Streptomyces sp. NBC_01571]MCX4581356.1 hypothetical protein [Streptomyces sp. NBC_01571]